MRFDGLASTNFTVAQYLAKNNEVYYIEHPYTLKDYFLLNKKSNEFKVREYGFKVKNYRLLENKVEGVNIVVPPPVIPIQFLPAGFIYNTLRNINEKIIANAINRILKAKKIKRYIYINAYDFLYPSLGKKINPILSVYHCVDPIPFYHLKHGIRDEKKLVENSDLIICTSKALYEEKKQQNPNTYFVPNASDVVNSLNDFDSNVKHPLLIDIKKPIVGYIGAIERRIDYELLQEVIESNQGLSFVFIGPISQEFVPLWFLKQQNVHFIPPIPYSEVPSAINSFDVALIPFKKDKISRNIFPLKLFEYLGMGKPVICTDFNDDLKEFTKDTVSFVNNKSSFSEALAQALIPNEELAIERRNIAKQNTWEKRANDISEILNGYLQRIEKSNCVISFL